MKCKPEKHLPYFSVLEALQESRGCSLCALETACMSRYFESLLYEHVNDPRIRAELARSKGYCARHARRLLECRDGFGTSILYQDHVRAFAEAIDEIAVQSKPRRAKNRAHWTLHEGCPACRVQQDARERHISVFLEWLGDAEMQRGFQESAGFCVPHFFAVMDATKQPATREFIGGVMREKYDRLLSELAEFQRKNNWQFCREPMGQEGDSWMRAVNMIVGDKDVF